MKKKMPELVILAISIVTLVIIAKDFYDIYWRK